MQEKENESEFHASPQYELTWEFISTADEGGDIGTSRINGVRNWIKGKQQPLT